MKDEGCGHLDFDGEGLERLMEGREDPHLASCADCREAARKLGRIIALLPQVPEEKRPADGWERDVLQRIPQEAPPTWWKKWWLLPVASMTAAVAALVVWIIVTPPKAEGMQIAIVHQERTMRSLDASAGDRISIRAARRFAHQALRLYRDGIEVASCPGSTVCHVDGNTLVLDAQLRDPGRYQILRLESDAELPAGLGTYDRDVGAAIAQGIRLEKKNVVVR